MSMFSKLKKLFVVAVASLLVFQTFAPMFVSGSAVSATLRDLDSNLGLLTKTKGSGSTFSAVLTGTVDTHAELPTIDVAQIAQTLTLQTTLVALLNQLFIALITSFLKALLGFFLNQFDTLVKKITQWADKVFGLKLNLCNVSRYVALQAYTLYNTTVDSISNNINKTFRVTAMTIEGPDSDLLDMYKGNALIKSQLINATTAYEAAKAQQDVNNRYPECAVASQPTNSVSLQLSDQKEKLKIGFKNAENLKKAESTLSLIKDIKKNPNFGLTTDLVSLIPAAETGVFTSTDSIFNTIDIREEKIGNSIADSFSNVKENIPIKCNGAVFVSPKNDNFSFNGKSFTPSSADVVTDRDVWDLFDVKQGQLENTFASLKLSDFQTDSDLLNTLSSSNKLGDSLGDYSKIYSVTPLNDAQCDSANIYMGKYNAIQASVTASSSGTAVDFGQIISGAIGQLINSFFDTLKALIDEIMNKLAGALIQKLNSLSGGVLNTSGISDAFATATASLNAQLDDVRQKVEKELAR